MNTFLTRCHSQDSMREKAFKKRFSLWWTHTIYGVWNVFNTLGVVFSCVLMQIAAVRQHAPVWGVTQKPCQHASMLQIFWKSLIFRSFWMYLDRKVASILRSWFLVRCNLRLWCLRKHTKNILVNYLILGKKCNFQPLERLKPGQSKPTPGSFLRSGAMCSWPATWAMG